MPYLKARLFAILIIVVCAGLIAVNWYQLLTEGRYYMKLAAFGPVGVVGGFFLLLFPAKGGKPESTRDKTIALVVFGIGIIGGLVNWYLMDPGFFSR
jgi:NhaP-type Na+/H+ or K+/H+ antiporter